LVGFVNSVIIVICWDELVNIKASDAKLPVIILLGIFLFCAFISFDQNEQTYKGFVIAFLLILGLAVINSLSAGDKEKRAAAGVFICLLVVVNTLMIFHRQYSFSYENNKGLKLAEDLSRDLYKCEADVIKELSKIDGVEDRLYRYSGETSINPGMLSGVSSTSFYLSALNPYDDLFQYELAMRNPTSWSPRDYDERTIANAIAAVRYYFRTDKDDLELPFGYSYIGEVDNAKEKRDAITRDIMKDQGSELNVPQLLYLGEKYKDINYYFRNDFALPMGFMYDRYIGESDIDGLAYNKKENVMLDAAVIADEFKEAAKGDEMARPFDEEQVPYIIFPEETTAAISPDGKFIVTDNSQQVTLLLEKPVKNAELFVEINNMTFERTLEKDLYFGDDKIYDPYGIYNPAEYERFSPRQKYDIIKESLMTKEPETTIAVKDDLDRKKGVEIFSSYDKNYCGREAVALNLCYSDEEAHKVIIEFQGSGVYKADSINIYGRKMDDYPMRIAALQDNVLENESIETDRITGEINALNDGLLYLSVPWSAGWKVYVDGLEETLIRANYLFSAVPMSKGHHSIELKYFTPFLRIGEIASIIGFIIFFVLLTVYEKRRKKKDESAE
ncbi:MAG: YfhO family protein, partial [Lachnospiraceae bacterium]|nr:YfhO family protein [Lachnospiraceae bacterium]